MDINFLMTAVTFIAVLTALTVEALKKLYDSVSKTYNATIMAVIVSFILSIASSICYVVYNSIRFTPQLVVVIIFLTFLSFLCATVGYDKVVKEIFEKIFNKKK